MSKADRLSGEADTISEETIIKKVYSADQNSHPINFDTEYTPLKQSRYAE